MEEYDTAEELINKLNEMTSDRQAATNYAEFQIRALLLIAKKLEEIEEGFRQASFFSR